MIRQLCFWLPAAVFAIAFGCAPQDELPSKGAVEIETPTPPQAVLSSQVPQALKERLQACLRHIHERDLLTTHSFWTVFHGILGMGFDTELVDSESRKKVKAIDFVCEGGNIRGMEFFPTAHGLDVRIQAGGIGVGQGHQDQFIAEMAQWGMTLDRKFIVNGKEYSFRDFVNHAKARATVKGNQELSWAIIIVSHFFGTQVSWVNQAKEKLSLEDVVRYELDQPIETAACGGTHRLFGLTWAYHLHLQKGGKKTGVWKDLADKLELYKANAKKFQNPEGAFSTNYVSRPGNAKEVQARIGSTGHVLEWLALTLTDDELRQPWVQEAANALVLMILENAFAAIDGGALYHAAHGLHIYHDRLFGPLPGRHAPLIPLPPKEKT